MHRKLHSPSKLTVIEIPTSVQHLLETSYLTMTLKELLSSSSTKAKLTTILVESLLADMAKVTIVLVYGTKIKGHSIETEHSHEEADTLIPNHFLDLLNDSFNEVCV